MVPEEMQESPKNAIYKAMNIASPRTALIVASFILAGLSLFPFKRRTAEDELKPGRHSLLVWTEWRNRSYQVHVPSGYDSSKPIPLVLIFHGAGGSGENSLDKNGWAAKAEKENFIALAPDGLPSRPGWPANFFLNPRLWNDGQLRPESQRSKIDDVAFIRALLDDIPKRVNIDPERIYVTGHSNGAGMTFRLGAELSERFAAIAAVAGYCWDQNAKPVRPLPTLYIIGTKDPLVPLAGGEAKISWSKKVNPPVAQTLATWAEALGIAGPPRNTQDSNGVKIVRYGQETDAASLTVLYIEGQGHGWPGGEDSKLPERWIGPSVDRIHATDVIWDFFKKYKK
jgi:polyhydroxybutyrate depolymerase